MMLNKKLGLARSLIHVDDRCNKFVKEKKTKRKLQKRSHGYPRRFAAPGSITEGVS